MRWKLKGSERDDNHIHKKNYGQSDILDLLNNKNSFLANLKVGRNSCVDFDGKNGKAISFFPRPKKHANYDAEFMHLLHKVKSATNALPSATVQCKRSIGRKCCEIANGIHFPAYPPFDTSTTPSLFC